jgi:hypothetical protein
MQSNKHVKCVVKRHLGVDFVHTMQSREIVDFYSTQKLKL